MMFPSREAVEVACYLDDSERSLLQAPSAPIVLLSPFDETPLVAEVSKGSPYVGAMLPYSPIHHILLGELGFPVVATSGNRSEEPIAIANDEALERLANIADGFLRHNRPIERPCDDSVARVVRNREMILRRARGYAPLPVLLSAELGRILAVGAHLKNAVAITVGRQVFLGQHVGDLETLESREAFRGVIADLSRLYDFIPEALACDLHPDYYSTQYAECTDLRLVRVQHHHAHVAACAAENDVDGPYLGVAWDGTGYGLDSTVWGGEFFRFDGRRFHRIAHLRSFPLLGGEQAIRDARRTSWSLLEETFGGDVPFEFGLSAAETSSFSAMAAHSLHSPKTTSVGRLLDGCAHLAGLGTHNRFEGQLPMLLEAVIGRARGASHYPVRLEEARSMELDWRPTIEALVADVQRRRPVDEIALLIHNTLVEWIVEVARRTGLEQVVLSGGVFQNGYLTARACDRLEQTGFRPYIHQRVPPNDGGIAVGQAVLAAMYLKGEIELPRGLSQKR